MSITAVSTNLIQRNKKRKINYISNISNSIESNTIQNNNLIDLKYGKTLVKPSNVSFGASLRLNEIDLSKKVSVAFQYLECDGVLLIGQDIKKAEELLKKLVKKVTTNEIKKLMFIEDKNFEGTIAISKNIHGYGTITNLEEKEISLKHPTFNNEAPLLKGRRVLIGYNNKISTQGSSFSINPVADLESENILKNHVKLFNLTKYNPEGVHNLNLNSLTLFEKELSPNEVPKLTQQITFKDVGGQDEAINTIKKKVLFQIKYPNYFKNNINQGGHGALLVGPPGNGKSLAALALANEAGVKFFGTNPQLLEEGTLGESEKRIHAFYQQLRENQPCIAFFDEANVIFPIRTGNTSNIHKENHSQLHYDEMSQLEKEGAKVYFMAATNLPNLMDAAALRRFQTQVQFTNPSTIERCKAVFDIHARNSSIEDFDCIPFMQKLVMTKVSCDDISNLIVDAQIEATERYGFFNEMEKDTFVDDPNFKLVIKGEDFEKALDILKTKRGIAKGPASGNSIQDLRLSHISKV